MSHYTASGRVGNVFSLKGVAKAPGLGKYRLCGFKVEGFKDGVSTGMMH